MDIDFSSETLLSLSAAAKLLPGRPHPSTLHRWRLRGLRGVKLKTVLIGGRRFTSSEALSRFSVAVTAASSVDRLPLRTDSLTQKDAERAERELNDAGI